MARATSNGRAPTPILQRRGRPYREIGSVGLEIANRKRLEQTERIHRRECFRTEKADTWSSDVYSATNETGFCIQPAGLLLERENKTALVNANSSTAYWLYDGTQKQLDKVVMFANSNNDIALKNAVKPEGKDYYNAFSIRCIKE